jgi:hypothetical protein
MARRGFLNVLIYQLVRALMGRKRKPHFVPKWTAKLQPWQLDKPLRKSKPRSQEEFVRDMQALAAETGDTSLQVMVPSGRRTKPNNLEFFPLNSPTQLKSATPFVSANVRIDHVQYGFHAYVHPRSHRDSTYWLYYVVSGPDNVDGSQGEHQITDEFRWTGERAWNPLLVKTALRQWVTRPEVVAAIALAKTNLPEGPAIPRKPALDAEDYEAKMVKYNQQCEAFSRWPEK